MTNDCQKKRLLTVKDLTIEYSASEGRLKAVDAVSLEVPKNKLIAVVGESGCGKSTLGLSIIGLLPMPPAKITGGSINYKDADLVPLNERQRREFRGTEIAMIFQEPLTSLNPVYKVGDQIAEAILVREVRSAKKSDLVNSDVMQKTYSSKTIRTSRIPRFRRHLSSDLREEIIEALRLVQNCGPRASDRALSIRTIRWDETESDDRYGDFSKAVSSYRG